MSVVEVIRGHGPLVLGLPHKGTWLPDHVTARLTDPGRELADTDWHVDRLYQGLIEGATTVRATLHRYLIDANRDPSGASLYPGQNTTGLVPLTDFDGAPLWITPPDAAEIEHRRQRCHGPYYAALEASSPARSSAMAWRSYTTVTRSAHASIPLRRPTPGPQHRHPRRQELRGRPGGAGHVRVLRGDRVLSVLNGRFKGGWTTRHYGRPLDRIHAIQTVFAQSSYPDAEGPPWSYHEAKAARLRVILARILSDLTALAPTLGATR